MHGLTDSVPQAFSTSITSCGVEMDKKMHCTLVRNSKLDIKQLTFFEPTTFTKEFLIG